MKIKLRNTRGRIINVEKGNVQNLINRGFTYPDNDLEYDPSKDNIDDSYGYIFNLEKEVKFIII